MVVHNDKTESEVAVRIKENEDVVTIQVANNGPGIPDSQKEENLRPRRNGH